MVEQFSLDFAYTEPGLVQLWTPDEIYDRIDKSNIGLFVEDRRVERKAGSVQPKALADYLSMWSNTQPHGGLILVGVDDAGKISGCGNLPQSYLNKIQSLTHLCPDARWVCKNVSVINAKGEEDFIIVYRVAYRADKLIETSGGEAFVREADKKIGISDVLKREMRIAKGEIHYELEPVSLKYPEDFEVSDIKSFCTLYLHNRRLSTGKKRYRRPRLSEVGKSRARRVQA